MFTTENTKEHYGPVTLQPLDYPIKSYDEHIADCSGMYDCLPLNTIENFEGSYFYSFSDSFKNVILIGGLIMVLMLIYRFLNKKK